LLQTGYFGIDTEGFREILETAVVLVFVEVGVVLVFVEVEVVLVFVEVELVLVGVEKVGKEELDGVVAIVVTEEDVEGKMEEV
jgi:hypothetical protein